MEINPVLALVVFILVLAVLHFVFRPTKGWYWVIRNSINVKDKEVIEDILKYLYHSETSGNKTDTKTIIQITDYKNKQVLDVIEKMTVRGLIYFDSDVLKLSKDGRNYALKIIRIHRLWERFLADKTGFEREEWHDMAEQMEHKLTTAETDKLSESLGNPQYDPHGDPIPSPTGKLAKVKGVELSQFPLNTIGRITHIEDEPEIIYKQILAQNIHMGSLVKVVENNVKRIVFHSEGEKFTLAPVVAANLTVAAVDENKEPVLEDGIARLSSLKENETAKIIGISKESRGESRRRLLDLGFVKGADIKIDLLNPLGNPNAYLIKGTSVALRHDQAAKILVKKD